MAKRAKLTDKQEAFAIEYNLNGGNAIQAYKASYDVGENTKDSGVYVDAHNVLHNPKVALRVDELRKQRFNKKILSIEERKILLSELSVDGDTKALEILNKMEGLYIEKKQLELSGPGGKPIETKWTVEFVKSDDE